MTAKGLRLPSMLLTPAFVAFFSLKKIKPVNYIKRFVAGINGVSTTDAN
ncbi:hypothetical protein EZS27_035687 [termite gut metagenome]|uniref:Uncharacterized protein n=1 Tax=termite gut metagenome TaxID=433724 RepID=A0A5J4PY29_9ZZZZ